MTACFTGWPRLPCLLDKLRRVGLVLKRSTGQARQLTMMAIGENSEELAVEREMIRRQFPPGYASADR